MSKKIGTVEFVNRVATNLNEAGYKVSKKDTKEFIMEAVKKAMYESLSEATPDEKVTVSPFDGLNVTCKFRAGRTGRNPLNGEAVQIPDKYVVSAKAMKNLTEFLND